MRISIIEFAIITKVVAGKDGGGIMTAHKFGRVSTQCCCPDMCRDILLLPRRKHGFENSKISIRQHFNDLTTSLTKKASRNSGHERSETRLSHSSGGSPPPLDDARFRGDTACLGIFIKALIDITEI